MKQLIGRYLNMIQENINPENIDLSSFETKKSLNNHIWDENGKLDKKVRTKLLKIADDFKESLEIPWVDYTDVILTGSLANYNWSKFSDVDLHILLNKSEISDNKELADEYLSSKKKEWNDTHDIKIHDFDVELYAQDINEKHTSSGVYSVYNNKWVIVPSKDKPKIDKAMVRRKSSDIMNSIDYIVKLNKRGDHTKVLELYEKLWDKIKTMRQAGLDRDGEFSYENIVFKVLRRTGYTDKLIDTKTDSYDKLNSL